MRIRRSRGVSRAAPAVTASPPLAVVVAFSVMAVSVSGRGVWITPLISTRNPQSSRPGPDMSSVAPMAAMCGNRSAGTSRSAAASASSSSLGVDRPLPGAVLDGGRGRDVQQQVHRPGGAAAGTRPASSSARIPSTRPK